VLSKVTKAKGLRVQPSEPLAPVDEYIPDQSTEQSNADSIDEALCRSCSQSDGCGVDDNGEGNVERGDRAAILPSPQNLPRTSLRRLLIHPIENVEDSLDEDLLIGIADYCVILG
jgi:hypothetical protein